MNNNTYSFRERFKRWKNGERYWSIVGRPLPHYTTGKDSEDDEYVSISNPDVGYLLGEQYITPKGNYYKTTSDGRPTISKETVKELHLPVYRENRQLKNNQPVYGETNRVANERADEYANRVSPSALDIVSAGTLGGLNNLSPTQWARRAYDLGEVIKGNMPWSEYGNRFIQGNEGVVSADYAKAYPYKSMAINTIGDIAAFGTASALRKLPKYAALMRAENRAAQESVALNWRDMLSNSVKRTKVGDIEIDNPNLLYHLDRGNGVGAFSTQGAYVENGFLFPGISKDASATPYSWWNKGKPFSTSVNGQPMTRLMTATKDTPGMIHVRSQRYPIGQWNGKMGFVRNSEYVNPEGVNVSGSTYILDPNYGWKKVSAKETPILNWVDATKTGNQFIHPAEAIRTGRQYVRPTVGRRNITTNEPLMVGNSKITITPKNATSVTPEQWTTAQDAAIARGDMAEAQRLRDLHFKVSAPDTQIVDKNGNPIHSYHGTGKRFNEFDTTGKYSTLDEGYYGKGAYFAPNKELAQIYADAEKTSIIYDTYLNIKNPLRHVRDENADLYGKVITDNDGVISTLPDDLVDETFDMTEYVATKPNQIKSADAVTYDNNGVRIPLGKRDNFKINDIRYGLLPFGIGLTRYRLTNN